MALPASNKPNSLEIILHSYTMPPRPVDKKTEQPFALPRITFEDGTMWTSCNVMTHYIHDGDIHQTHLPLLFMPGVISVRYMELLESNTPVRITAKHFTARRRDVRLDRESEYGGLIRSESFLQVISIEPLSGDSDGLDGDNSSVVGRLVGTIHRVLSVNIPMMQQRYHRVVVQVKNSVTDFVTVNVPATLVNAEFTLTLQNEVTLETTVNRRVNWLANTSTLLAGIENASQLQRLQQQARDHFIVTEITPASDASALSATEIAALEKTIRSTNQRRYQKAQQDAKSPRITIG